MNQLVGFEKEDCLDRILEKTDIPNNFDLLSIDIDGNDYHVWKAITDYRPKVVIIEFNPTIPKCIEFVQSRDMTVRQGTSLLSNVKLANSKGYELIAVEAANGIFVDKQYFPLFKIDDKSIDALWNDQSSITHMFVGFDGTIFLRGKQSLPLLQIPIKESAVQVLPRWARKTFKRQNWLARKLGKYYRRKLKQK